MLVLDEPIAYEHFYFYREERRFYMMAGDSNDFNSAYTEVASLGDLGDSEWRRFFEGIEGSVDLDQELVDAWEKLNWRGDDNRMYYGGRRLVASTDRPVMLDRIVRDIEHNEPLTLIYSWPLLESAKQKGVNLVAVLDDSYMTSFDIKVTMRQPLLPVLKEFDYYSVNKYDEALDCWTVYPKFAQDERAKRLDRRHIGNLLRKSDEKGWFTLDDAAQFQRETGLDELPYGWSKLVKAAMNSYESKAEWGSYHGLLIRLYSALSPSQRRAAWSGGIVLPKRVWPVAMERALRGFDTLGRFDVPVGTGENSEVQYDNVGRKLSSVVSEGLPLGSTLEIKVESVPKIFVANRRERAYGYTPEVFAGILLRNEKEVKTGAKPPLEYDTDKVCLPPQQTLSVTLRVPGVGHYTFSSAAFSRTPVLQDLHPYSRLPADFRRQVADALAKAREGGL